MKDVRRADGWTVNVYLGDAVTIEHVRWEQSLDAVDSPGHFEIQWKVQMSFDRQLSDMKAVFVRVLQVVCSPNMDKNTRQEIEARYIGRGYIV